MVFSTTVFLAIFLPVVLALYYIPFFNRKVKNRILFFASLLFYAYGEPWFVFVMLLSITANWIFGLLTDKCRSRSKRTAKVIVGLMVVFNLTIIFIFKYLMFTLNTMNCLLHTDISVPEITLPIGISFFTFQAISYVIDVYRGNGRAQKNPMHVGLYIALFPQLIAGPIVRYETIAEQIEHRKENFEKFSEGVCRFIIGLSKKCILANSVARLADAAFGSDLTQISAGYAWLGAIAYTFQILFDFSGYSDMAIGLGKMFGFEFLENFNYPYISKSITEFWRRWHISLGTWFRDYVYFPLGGSRVKSKARLIFNLFVVWACTGLWHGASWTFILWGILYFVLLVFEKLTGFANSGKMPVLKHIYTMFFVIMGWVLFRADAVSNAKAYFKAMFGMGGAGLWDNDAYFYFCEYAVTFAICIIACFPWRDILNKLKTKLKYSARSGAALVIQLVQAAAYTGLFVVCLAYIAKSSYNPFIYFNF